MERGKHWTLVVIHLSNDLIKMEHYDSLEYFDPFIPDKIKQWMLKDNINLKDIRFELQNVKSRKQPNYFDCGFFSVLFGLEICLNQRPGTSQIPIQQFKTALGEYLVSLEKKVCLRPNPK
jgi:Ulp1 family protease